MTKSKQRQYISPNCFPSSIGATFTTRQGGVSKAPYENFNTAFHVGDSSDSVEENRRLLKQDLGVKNIAWLDQIHGVGVVKADCSEVHTADALWTNEPHLACAIEVADCMPLLISNLEGTKVGAAHAGWRSLCGGVIHELFLAMQLDPSESIVWTGPCIQQQAFEVGPEVKQAFQNSNVFRSLDLNAAFKQGTADRLQADLPLLANLQLEALGCRQVHHQSACTYHESERFFSYRRDGKTGRMTALVWINSSK